MSLEDARRRIDHIDEEIIHLLDERARVAVEIGKLKHALHQPLFQPGREEEVVLRLRSLSDGSLPPESIDAVYRTIMGEMLALQQRAGSGPCAGHTAVSGKIDVAATVVENVMPTPGFHRMRLRAPELAGKFAPGQFFQITVGGGGPGFFLRRPFAPSAYLPDGIAFHYAVVGGGTEQLSHVRPGEKLRVLAPLGNTFTLAPEGSRVVLIGGGCGVPGLVPLAFALKERGVDVVVFAGARTSAALIGHDLFRHAASRVVTTTDDGSAGCKGTAIDALRLEREKDSLGKIDFVYALGPIPMLRAAARLAGELGVGCEASLEERMACGFGACVGCVVPVKDGRGGSVYRRVCHDGPVFTAETLAWEEMKK